MCWIYGSSALSMLLTSNSTLLQPSACRALSWTSPSSKWVELQDHNIRIHFVDHISLIANSPSSSDLVCSSLRLLVPYPLICLLVELFSNNIFSNRFPLLKTKAYKGCLYISDKNRATAVAVGMGAPKSLRLLHGEIW